MPLPHGLVAMDLFGDDTLVRLRSRVHGTHLHADEDGAGVSLRAHGHVPSRNAGHVPSRNAVWRVRRCLYRFLLQSTATGAYLAVSNDPAPPGFGGYRTVQRNYDGDVQELGPFDDIVWRPVMADDEGEETFVFLRNSQLSLRASGTHPIWHTGVTVDRAFNHDASSSPIKAHWAVEIIPVPAPAHAPSSSLIEEKSTEFAYSPSSKEKAAKTKKQSAPLETDSLSSATRLSGKEFRSAESELQASSSTVRDDKTTGSAYLPSSKEQFVETEPRWNSVESDSPSPANLSGKEFQPAETVLQASSSSVREDNYTGSAYVSSSKEKIVKNENLRASLEKNSLPSPAAKSKIQDSFRKPYICLGCSQNSTNCLCNKCRERMRTALLKARGASLGTGTFCLCLKCLDLVKDDHCDGAHKTHSIPLHTIEGSQVACVKTLYTIEGSQVACVKKEIWSPLFDGIQSDRYYKSIGIPFPLHSLQGWRCEGCADYLSEDKLFETPIRFCTIECWTHKAEAAPEFGWVKALLNAGFNSPGEDYYYCNVCRCVFNEQEVQGHVHELEVQGLRLITSIMSGSATVKVEVPSDHFMARYWFSIKDLSGGGNNTSSPVHLYRLRSQREQQRCRECKMRLEDGGGRVCSLECNLQPVMLPRETLRSQKSDAA